MGGLGREKSEDRNPKSEGRPKSEIRDPKGTMASTGPEVVRELRLADDDSGSESGSLPGPIYAQPFLAGRGGGGKEISTVTKGVAEHGLRASDFLRISAFGFRMLQLHILGPHFEALILVLPDHGGI